MNIRILGCYGGVPSKDGACSSFLIKSEEANILVECGSGITSKVQNYIDLKDLTAIVISHLHFDHFNDLFTMYYLYKVGINRGALKRIPVYIPMGPIDTMKYLITQMSDVFDFVGIDHGDMKIFGDIKIELHRTQHDVECYAMRIQDKHETVGYTADTGYNEDLVKFLTGCSTIIAESSLLETLPNNPNHMTARKAVMFGINAKAERVVLTHFWYGLDLLDYVEETYILRNERGSLGIDIHYAQEGVKIKGGVVTR